MNVSRSIIPNEANFTTLSAGTLGREVAYAIILISFNNTEDTVECVKSILGSSGDWRIIIVENGRTTDCHDRIAALVGESGSEISGARITCGLIDAPYEVAARNRSLTDHTDDRILIVRTENDGFAAANTVGIELSRKLWNPQYYWLLNNDTVIEPDTGTLLYDHAEKRPDLGIVGSSICYFDSPELLQGHGARFDVVTTRGSYIDHLERHDASYDEATIERSISYVIGASMFVRREFVEKIGLMEENYFLYFEELDWAVRAGEQFRMGICLPSRLLHKEGSSIGTSTLGRPSRLATFFLSRSMVLFYAKHFPWRLGTVFLRQGFNAGRFVARRDFENAKASLDGLASGIVGAVLKRGPKTSRTVRAYLSPRRSA